MIQIKYTIKNILLSIILVSMVFLASACMKHSSSDNNNQQTKNKEEPITITWYWREGGNIQVPDDSYISQKILKDLNIKYIHVSPKMADSSAKLQSLIASGDIPDIIESYTDQTTKLKENGLIIPIENYLTPDIMGNVINISNNWETAMKMVERKDGHIWAVPCTFSTTLMDVPWIRYDWLENLNLKVPTTYAQLADILYKFTYNDPDQNNKADTLGTTLIGSYSNVISLNFGADPEKWYQDEQGNLELGSLNPRIKEYLKYVRSLISAGVSKLDTNTLSTKQIENSVKSGQLGFALSWGNEPTNWNSDIQKIQPSADWRPMPPPKGVYNKGYLPSGNILREEYVISLSCNNVDAAFALMNYMAEDFSTEQKMEYTGNYWEASYGKRGVNWDITVDGKFDYMGNFFPEIAKQNKIDNYVGRCRRWRNKFDEIARLSGLSEEGRKDAIEISTYPLASDMPEDDRIAPINTEGVEFPTPVIEFLENYMNKKWNKFFYRVILSNSDIDSEWESHLKEAYDDGYAEIKVLVKNTLATAQ